MARSASPRRAGGPAFSHHREDWFILFAAWQDSLISRGLSEDTYIGYGKFLLGFSTVMRLDPRDATEEILNEFLAGVRRKGKSWQEYVSTFKSFYGYAHRKGEIEENPASELKHKAPKYPPAVSLTGEEFTRVVYAAANRRPYPLRALAVILMVETGGRIGSVAAVRVEDAGTVAGQHIRFNKAKGDRPYVVPLSPVGAWAVRELLSLPRRNGALLDRSKNTLWLWYHTAAVEAGLPKRKQRAHMLRDTFATNLLERGENPRVVQELLNHADFSQMKRYWAVTDKGKRRTMARSVTDEFPE